MALLSYHLEACVENNMEAMVRPMGEEMFLPFHMVRSRTDADEVRRALADSDRDRRLGVIGGQRRSYQMRRPHTGTRTIHLQARGAPRIMGANEALSAPVNATETANPLTLALKRL